MLENRMITAAVEELKRGRPIAIPTETVYGLAANGLDQSAVKRIFELKNRPLSNPLILHTYDISEIEKYTSNIPDIAYKLAERFWPGPLTMIFEKNENVPELVTAGGSTVAFRIPDHDIALELLKRVDFPLAAPSANPFTRISPTHSSQVKEYFGEELFVVDGGPCTRGLESTIIGFEREAIIIYRLGSVTESDLKPFASQIRIQGKKSKVRTPGMHAKHYSPLTTTILTEDPQKEINKFNGTIIGVITFEDTFLLSNNQLIKKVLSPEGNIKSAAAKLYSTLYDLDKLDLDVIIVKRFPNKGLGKTINERLNRAAHNSMLEE